MDRGTHLRTTELVGRDDEIAWLRRAIVDGGALLVGQPGVGTSRLALDVARGHAGAGTVVLRGTPRGDDVPFAALAPLLADLGLADGPSAPALVRGLQARSADDAMALVVEDAHALDPASSAMLTAVVAAGVVPVLAVVRRGATTPEGVLALWKDGLLPRLDVDPLGLAAMRALAASWVDGDVHPWAAEQLARLGEGRPLLLRELVVDALDSGALALDERRQWRWHGDRLQFRRLEDLVCRQVAGASTAGCAVLDRLAVAGGRLERDVLGPQATDGVLEELEHLGVVEVEVAPDTWWVTLSSRMLRRVLAARIPAVARTRILLELAARLAGRDELHDDAVLRLATWRLDAGEVADDSFVEASEFALRSGNPALALRLAEALPRGLPALVARAASLLALGRSREAGVLLLDQEDVARDARDDDLRLRWLQLAMRALAGSSPQDRDLHAVFDRVDGWDLGPGVRETVRTEHDCFRSVRTGTQGRAGEAPLPDPSSVDPRARLGMLHGRLLIAQMTGRMDDAVARVRDLTAMAEEMEVPPWHSRALAGPWTLLVRAEDGRDLATTAARLDDLDHRAGDQEDLAVRGFARYAAGVVALRRGRLAAAVDWLETSEVVLRAADPLALRPNVLMALVEVHVRRSDLTAACRALDALEHCGADGDDPGMVAPGTVRARALVRALEGHRTAAVEGLVEMAHAGSGTFTGALALHDAVRLGADPGPAAARMSCLAGTMQSQLVTLMADELAAVAIADHEGLIACARRYAALELLPFAVGAAERAATELHDQGRHDPARTAHALANTWLARCEDLPMDPVSGLPSIQRLTPREAEIAMMAASGRTNREIADDLVLSVRTVETVVLRASRKLGVRGRAGLAEIFEAA